MRDFVAVPVGADVLARALDRHDDYRVLRRVRPMERRLGRGVPEDGLVGVALAVSTTGPDHRRHEILQLSMQRFILDAQGRVVETGILRDWLERPSELSDCGWLRVAGLCEGDVAGRAIAEGEASCAIASADFVVSHGASADRPFVERRLPLAAGRPWACARADMDWSTLGFGDDGIQALLADMGRFGEPGRTGAKVTALLHILDHRLDVGETVARRLVKRGRRSTWIVDASGAPSAAEDVLRDRGYRWDPARRLWSASVEDEAVEDEVGWATIMLYGGRRGPATRRITWLERHAEVLG